MEKKVILFSPHFLSPWFYQVKVKWLYFEVDSSTWVKSGNIRGMNYTQVICIIWLRLVEKVKLLRNLTQNTGNFPNLNIGVTFEHKSLTLNTALCSDEHMQSCRFVVDEWGFPFLTMLPLLYKKYQSPYFSALSGIFLVHRARSYDKNSHFINGDIHGEWWPKWVFFFNSLSQAPSLKAWLFLTRTEQQSNHILSWSEAQLLDSVLAAQKEVAQLRRSPFFTASSFFVQLLPWKAVFLILLCLLSASSCLQPTFLTLLL